MLLIYIGKYQQKHFNLFFQMLIISETENKHTENNIANIINRSLLY